jgi:hypothetical protein
MVNNNFTILLRVILVAIFPKVMVKCQKNTAVSVVICVVKIIVFGSPIGSIGPLAHLLYVIYKHKNFAQCSNAFP